MTRRWLWLMILGLALLLLAAPLSLGLAGEAEKKEPIPAAPTVAEKPAGLVGTIVAVAPESRTLVVDVPLGKDVLRIGATVTDKTKIEAAGKAAPFENLERGARVRITFRRIETGDEAISVEVLRGPKS
ncbi:MAG: hypothetical protein ACM362_05205 [Candidatus Methylomirabilota bacterium]